MRLLGKVIPSPFPTLIGIILASGIKVTDALNQVMPLVREKEDQTAGNTEQSTENQHE
jgi:hypothetical protein